MFRFRARAVSTGTAPEFLVVGLGNPGKKYALTRHNAGFLFLEAFALKHNVKINRIRFKSLTGDATVAGHRCILMMPQTYMNNSGEAVREAADFYKIPPEKVIVIFDDTALPSGALRIRRSGSDGGHNGIKSLLFHLRTDNFPRIKLGIGAKPHAEMELADWVLSAFGKEDLAALRAVADKAGDALELILNGDIEQAMARYN